MIKIGWFLAEICSKRWDEVIYLNYSQQLQNLKLGKDIMCVLLWVSEIMLIYRAGRFQPIPEITIPIPDLSGDSDSDSQISGPIPTPKIFTDSDSKRFRFQQFFQKFCNSRNLTNSTWFFPKFHWILLLFSKYHQDVRKSHQFHQNFQKKKFFLKILFF